MALHLSSPSSLHKPLSNLPIWRTETDLAKRNTSVLIVAISLLSKYKYFSKPMIILGSLNLTGTHKRDSFYVSQKSRKAERISCAGRQTIIVLG